MPIPFSHFSDGNWSHPWLLSVIPHIPHFGPSLDPTGCSFMIHSTFNLFLVLFCYHLGPSNHHLSPGLEPSFHTGLLSSTPHHVQLSALLHVSSLTSILVGCPAVLIMVPLHMHFSQMKCLSSGYPRGSFFTPLWSLLKYYLHSKTRL